MNRLVCFKSGKKPGKTEKPGFPVGFLVDKGTKVDWKTVRHQFGSPILPQNAAVGATPEKAITYHLISHAPVGVQPRKQEVYPEVAKQRGGEAENG